MSETPIALSYQPPAEIPMTGWAIIRWWEFHRLIYNGVMLGLGLLILAAAWKICLLGKVDLSNLPAALPLEIIFFGICANVAYTGGWILDLAWKEPDAAAAARRRRGIFLGGLIFSCLILTIPLWLALGAVAMRHI